LENVQKGRSDLRPHHTSASSKGMSGNQRRRCDL